MAGVWYKKGRRGQDGLGKRVRPQDNSEKVAFAGQGKLLNQGIHSTQASGP